MAIRDVASYLTRFDAPQQMFSPPAPDALFEPSLHEPAGGVDATHAEIREELQCEFDARLAEARADYEGQLEEARRRWTEEQAQALSHQLTRALDVALGTLRVDVSRVLTPFVSRRLSAQIMEDLLTTVRAGLANDKAPGVDISGPPDLIADLGAALGQEGVALTRRESDGIDATITFDTTTIETRLGEWVARLASGREKDHE